MKTRIFIFVMILVLGATLGIVGYRSLWPELKTAEGKIALEEILSIKELHLVRHTYRDLFYLHRQNDPHKAIRAIVEVPVSVTAFINLKDIRIVRHNDTIRTVILPQAKLYPAVYDLDRMTIRKTRSFQLHIGRDLYPEVSDYLKNTLVQRLDSMATVATRNQILEQAEAEGKEYIETILKGVGRGDVMVTFGNTEKDKRITLLQNHLAEVRY